MGMAFGAALTFGIIAYLAAFSNDPLLLREFGPLNFILATFMFGMIGVIALDAILKTEILK
jgi:hypothetical protein